MQGKKTPVPAFIENWPCWMGLRISYEELSQKEWMNDPGILAMLILDKHMGNLSVRDRSEGGCWAAQNKKIKQKGNGGISYGSYSEWF